MPTNSFSDLFASLTQMMTSNASTFELIGQRLYASFAVIMIVWFGVEWALRGTISMDRFANMLLMISFGFAMTRFYSTPIPGFGRSFYHLVIDEGQVLASQLSGSMIDQVMKGLDNIYFGMETPGLSAVINTLEFFRWAVIALAIVSAEFAVFAIISFGYIAAAVAVLLGPIFVPFFIVPKMEWLFWGWLRALLQYSFYPVVAHAYVFVMGSLLINFTGTTERAYTAGEIAVLFVPLLFLLVSFTWGLLKVPSLVNSLFTGKSGESALPF